MLINSEFRDYYDSLQQYSEDAKTYQRHTSFTKDKSKHWRNECVNIYFCGKLYPMFNANFPVKDKDGIVREKVFWRNSLEEFDRLAEEYFDNKQLEFYHKYMPYGKTYEKYGSSVPRRSDFYYDYQNKVEGRQIYSIDQQVFIDNLCPVYITCTLNTLWDISSKLAHQAANFYKINLLKDKNTPVTWLNPQLDIFEFYRIFDHYKAYQEIEMYLNNMAFPNKEIPVISDKIMIEIKGFCPKTSFRKPKSK